MIPVKTLQPVERRAYATYGLILVNVLIFLWQLTLGPRGLYDAFWSLALVPCQIGAVTPAETLLDTFRSMFFHGSWAHLIGNMTYLWIFGRNLEDYLGSRKFLALYLFWGFAAALAQTLGSPALCIPMIGASGAISGVLGSYLLCFPGTRVQVMVIWFRFFPKFYNIPSLVVLGAWFGLQLFNGVLSLGVDTASGGVAFFAHIGGFVVGLATIFIYMLFAGPPKRIRWGE